MRYRRLLILLNLVFLVQSRQNVISVLQVVHLFDPLIHILHLLLCYLLVKVYIRFIDITPNIRNSLIPCNISLLYHIYSSISLAYQINMNPNPKTATTPKSLQPQTQQQ